VPHRTGGGENCPDGEINIRAEVWKNIIQMDNYKQKCIDKFLEENPGSTVSTPEALYEHFKSKALGTAETKFETTLKFDIMLDLDRSDLGN
jgi:hypothetical protein